MGGICDEMLSSVQLASTMQRTMGVFFFFGLECEGYHFY